jgi:hypothetical protein
MLRRHHGKEVDKANTTTHTTEVLPWLFAIRKRRLLCFIALTRRLDFLLIEQFSLVALAIK